MRFGTIFRTLTSGVLILLKTLFFYVLVVFWIGLVAFLIPVPMALIEHLVGRREPTLALGVFHWGIGITSCFYRLAARVTLDAEARVSGGTAVVIGNHHSFLDIWLVLHLFPHIRLSVKPSLFRIPFLGWGAAVFGHFAHDPGAPEQALEKGAEWIRRGRYVGMFPEGTRCRTNSIGPFLRGAFVLAQRTTQRVQPVVVVGTDRVWTKGQFWIRQLGPVHMKVLHPVDVPSHLGRRELRELIDEVRAAMLDEHEKLDHELTV